MVPGSRGALSRRTFLKVAAQLLAGAGWLRLAPASRAAVDAIDSPPQPSGPDAARFTAGLPYGAGPYGAGPYPGFRVLLPLAPKERN